MLSPGNRRDEGALVAPNRSPHLFRLFSDLRKRKYRHDVSTFFSEAAEPEPGDRKRLAAAPQRLTLGRDEEALCLPVSFITGGSSEVMEKYHVGFTEQ